MPKKNTNQIPDFKVDNWSGLNTSITNPDDMAPGSSPDALNWLTGASQNDKGKYFGDHIELRRGTTTLQSTASAGVVPVSGLGVGIKNDGTQIPVFSIGSKLFYYDITSNTNIEISTNLLGTPAINDDVAIVPYQSFSGSQILISSPNSSIFKLMVADITNPVDLQSLEYRGYISTSQSRMMLWTRKGATSGNDFTDLFVSHSDGTQVGFIASPTTAPYLFVNAIVGSGTANGTNKTFTDVVLTPPIHKTLFNVQAAASIAAPMTITGITKATAAVITIVGHTFVVGDVLCITGVTGMTEINNLIAIVTVVSTNLVTVNINSSAFTTYGSGGTAGKAESFRDDGNGNMISNLGGTGTINYVTGAYSLTFNTAPYTGVHVLFSLIEEDSTDHGTAYFIPNLGTAVAGDPSVYPQYGFGNLMNVFPLSGVFFCMHQYGTYQLSIPNNDVTQSSQIIYRNNVGIPNWRAGYATGDGIIYLDTLNQVSPKLRMLTMDYSLSNQNPSIVPESISDQLNLSLNGFSKAVVYEWGDYYLLACQGFNNGVSDTNNDRIYLRNKKTGFYDLVDYRANCFANFYGALIAGDSITSNPQVLFSGFDDLGYNINNYWTSPGYLLGWPGMKKVTKGKIKGLIQPNQNIQVWLSFDNSQYVLYETVIGQNQNQGIPTTVGGQVVGSTVVGGSGAILAYPYEVEFSISSDLFNRVSFKLVATGSGYASTDEFTFEDIRLKSSKIYPNSNTDNSILPSQNIIQSPNGTWFSLQVDDSGHLLTTPLVGAWNASPLLLLSIGGNEFQIVVDDYGYLYTSQIIPSDGQGLDSFGLSSSGGNNYNVEVDDNGYLETISL